MNMSISVLFLGGLKSASNAYTTVLIRLVIVVPLVDSFTILVFLICVVVPRFGGVVEPVSKILSIIF